MPRHSPGSVQQVGPLSSTRHTPRACAPRRTRGMLAPGCQRRRRPTRTQVWGSRGHSVRTLHTGGWGGGQIERDIHTGESLATDRQPLLNCSNRCSFAHPASYFLSTSITLLTFLRVCVMCAFLHSLTLFTFFLVLPPRSAGCRETHRPSDANWGVARASRSLAPCR